MITRMRALLLVLLGVIPGFCQNLATVTFSANASPIFSGGSSSLSWSTVCPDSCTYTIDQGVGTVSASGTRSVSPHSTTLYTLQVVSANGIAQKTALVVVGSGALNVTQGTDARNGGPGCPAGVAQWDVCELSFTYPAAGCDNYATGATGCSGTVANPWEDVNIAATFTATNSNRTYTVNGFYEGGVNSGTPNDWKVRFAPPIVDNWN